eukprot:1161587-Pelagomonas_calceolata.AAC.19
MLQQIKAAQPQDPTMHTLTQAPSHDAKAHSMCARTIRHARTCTHPHAPLVPWVIAVVHGHRAADEL